MKPSQVWVRRRFDPGPARREVTDADFDLLLAGDCDVFKPGGQRLCSLRRGLVSEAAAGAAFPVLDKVRMGSLNRGDADGERKLFKVRQDGTQSRTQEASRRSPSSIIGFFDRSPRYYFCRQLSFNAKHPELFAQLGPFLGEVAEGFRCAVPDRYAVQLQHVARTPPEFVIQGTPWTTLTVNHNWATRLHTDRGDLETGFSVIACFRRGSYTGGLLVFPAYRVAVDLQDRGVLFMDAHELHGNTSITGGVPFQRTTVVLYFRQRMTECGSAAEELERVKRHAGALDEEDGDNPL